MVLITRSLIAIEGRYLALWATIFSNDLERARGNCGQRKDTRRSLSQHTVALQFRWSYLAVIPACGGIHHIPIGKILSILFIAVKNGLRPPELQRYRRSDAVGQAIIDLVVIALQFLAEDCEQVDLKSLVPGYVLRAYGRPYFCEIAWHCTDKNCCVAGGRAFNENDDGLPLETTADLPNIHLPVKMSTRACSQIGIWW